MKQAQVTVFLSLTLTLMISILFSFLESARTAALKVYWETACRSSVESAFAEYQGELMEEYQLLARYDPGDGIAQDIEEYLSYYGDPDRQLLTDGGFWLSFTAENIEIPEKSHLLEESGRVFYKNLEAGMKYRAVGNLIQLAGERLDIWNQAKRLAACLGGLYEKVSGLIPLEEICRSTSQCIEAAGEAKRSLAEKKDALEEAERNLAQIQDAEDTVHKEELVNLCQKVYENCYGEWRNEAENLLQVLEEICGNGKRYQEESVKLSKELKDAVQEAVSQGETLSGTFQAIVEEQTKTAEEYLKGSKERVEKMEAAVNAAAGQRELLKLWMDEGQERDGIWQEIPNGLNLGETAEDPEKKAQGEAVLNQGESLSGEGLMALLLPEGSILPARVMEDEDIPSGCAYHDGRGEYTLWERGILTEYGAETLSHFTKEGKTDCDLEYICGSKTSDWECLKETAAQLTAAREGLNLAAILTMPDKCREAELIAQAMVGFTGFVPAVLLVKYLILSAWALCESAADVRHLLDGGKVPLMKGREDWKLELSSLLNPQEWRREKEEKGLSYDWYLRLLLLLKDPETLCYRIMDVIQWRMRRLDSEFSLENCVTDASIVLTGSQGKMFYSPFIPADRYSTCCEIEWDYAAGGILTE